MWWQVLQCVGELAAKFQIEAATVAPALDIGHMHLGIDPHDLRDLRHPAIVMVDCLRNLQLRCADWLRKQLLIRLFCSKL